MKTDHRQNEQALAPRERSLFITVIIVLGAILLPICGIIAFFAETLAGWPLLSPWVQVSLAYTGITLLLISAYIPTIEQLARGLLAIGGLTLLLAVGDSLNGRQDVLPFAAMALLLWALIYTHATAQIIQTDQGSRIRRAGAIGLGVLATAIYLGVAIYYVIINWNSASVHVFQHPLFLIGIIIDIALRWLGKLPSYNAMLGRRTHNT